MSTKRFFLMKAHLKPENANVFSGFDWTFKYDGMRCLWDGGLTRDRIVPWYPSKPATGLWSMNANPIFAPDEFLDSLPTGFALDGELTAGHSAFQETMSICRKHTPVPHEWRKIRYAIFDLPAYSKIFAPGRISTPTCKVNFDFNTVRMLQSWQADYMEWNQRFVFNRGQLEQTLSAARDFLPSHANDQIFFAAEKVLPENILPDLIPGLTKEDVLAGGLRVDVVEANDILNKCLDFALNRGFEGLMFRKKNSIWAPVRSSNLLKYKPTLEDEGIVIGFQYGREGKFLGKMGALILDSKGKQVRISGFTDEERRLGSKGADFDVIKWASDRAGVEELHDYSAVSPVHFPTGTVVTYSYRELTNDGYPKDARYRRVRPDE